jgi:hypothetical protein
MKQFSSTEIERRVLVYVLNQGEEGWGEKSLSRTRKAGKEPI